MQIVVELALIDQLGVIGVDWLNLDGHLQVGPGVHSLEDLPKSTLINFSENLEVFAHFFQHLWHVSPFLNEIYYNSSNRLPS